MSRLIDAKEGKVDSIKQLLVLLIMLTYALVLFYAVTAASEGPNSPGTMADDDAVGTKVWSDTDNAKVSDNAYSSTATMTAAQISHYLKATNFGFSIPSGATIDGILVEIERKKLGLDKLGDNEVKIVKSDGSIGTENKAIVTNWITTDAYFSYGDSSDLWSESWSDADINDLDFGVVLAVKNEETIPDESATPHVDHIRITVDYTDRCACPDSGDWVGLFSDNCAITTDCNMQGNSVIITGSGTWDITAKIYNFDKFVAHGGTVVCRNTNGCFG